MKEVTKKVHDGIMAELENVIEHCKNERMYKPHLYSMLNHVMDPDNDTTIEDIEYGVLAELDQAFIDEHLQDMLNPYEDAKVAITLVKHEWFVRLPEWLMSVEFAIFAEKAYRSTMVNNYYVPWTHVDEVPAYTDLLIPVKPMNYTIQDMNTPIGKTKIKVKLTPTIQPNYVRKLFKTVIELKDHVNKEKASDLQVSIPGPILNFLTAGEIPENLEERAIIASFSTSPTPYTAVLAYLIRNATNSADMEASGSLNVLRSKAVDMDIEYGALLRANGKPVLTNRQMMALINKHIDKNGLKGVLDGKTVYYTDYRLLESVRYFPDPSAALQHFNESINYFQTLADQAKEEA